MSYDGPEASNKDAVRFLIGDTSSTLLTDQEVQFLVDKWLPIYGTVEYVAAVAASTIAARFAREVSYSADGVSIGLGAAAQQFRDLAASLREQHKNLLVGGLPDVGGITPGEETAHDVKPFDFGTGMHDNPEGGRQNYGSRNANGYYVPEYHPGA